MRPEIGEVSGCRQSKIDFLSKALCRVVFSLSCQFGDDIAGAFSGHRREYDDNPIRVM